MRKSEQERRGWLCNGYIVFLCNGYVEASFVVANTKELYRRHIKMQGGGKELLCVSESTQMEISLHSRSR
jgi:hypothetical protein